MKTKQSRLWPVLLVGIMATIIRLSEAQAVTELGTLAGDGPSDTFTINAG